MTKQKLATRRARLIRARKMLQNVAEELPRDSGARHEIGAAARWLTHVLTTQRAEYRALLPYLDKDL